MPQGRTQASAVGERHHRPVRPPVLQHGVGHNHAGKAIPLAAGFHAVGKLQNIAAENPGAKRFQRLRIPDQPGLHGGIRNDGFFQTPGLTLPTEGHAPRIKGHPQIAQVFGGKFGGYDQHRLSGRSVFHHGIWSHIRTRPQIAVGMAAHNHVHGLPRRQLQKPLIGNLPDVLHQKGMIRKISPIGLRKGRLQRRQELTLELAVEASRV